MKARLNSGTRWLTAAGVTATFIISGLLVPAGLLNRVSAEEQPSVESILAHYTEAVGGCEALEKLTTRICKGKEITDLPSRQQPIYESHYFEAYTKIPRSCFTAIWSDAEIYRRGYDGNVGWIKDKCGVRHDDHAGKSRLEWLLNPQFALQIEDYFPGLILTGIEWVRGMRVYVLESPESPRPLSFDTQTGLLIGFGHNWEIHDYREIDGVLFPHRVVESRKGGSTTYEFIDVSHNEDISDSVFLIPASGKEG